MRTGDFRSHAFRRRDQMLGPIFKSEVWVGSLVCLGMSLAVPLSDGIATAEQSGGSQAPTNLHDASQWPPMNPLANRTADPNRILEDSIELQINRKLLKQMNVQRQKEMTADTAKLLALANELKAELDKSSTDELPMDVLRKAEQIEKLAHGVQEKMKSSIGN